MGVRSYNKKDPSKNTYRVKYSNEKVEKIVEEKKTVNENLTNFLIKYTGDYLPKPLGGLGLFDMSILGEIKDSISDNISKNSSNIFWNRKNRNIITPHFYELKMIT